MSSFRKPSSRNKRTRAFIKSLSCTRWPPPPRYVRSAVRVIRENSTGYNTYNNIIIYGKIGERKTTFFGSHSYSGVCICAYTQHRSGFNLIYSPHSWGAYSAPRPMCVHAAVGRGNARLLHTAGRLPARARRRGSRPILRATGETLKTFLPSKDKGIAPRRRGKLRYNNNNNNIILEVYLRPCKSCVCRDVGTAGELAGSAGVGDDASQR